MPESKKSNTEIVKFDIENAVIVALDNKYKDVQIIDGKSYAIVMEGLREYRELRLAVVDGHKDQKKDALDFCNFLDAEKRRILARLAPGEERLKAIRQAYDDEKARIKAEKEAKEKARVDGIRAKIFKIQAMITGINIMNQKGLRELSEEFEDIEITEDEYMEFTEDAKKVLDDSYNAVQEAIAARIQFDKEEATRKVEAERLEKQRKEQEAAQAKIDEENRRIREENEKIERRKKAEIERYEREEFERQAKIKAEQEAKEKAEREERERIERKKAEEEEKARQEALKPDRDKLKAFAKYLQEDIQYPDLQSKKSKEMLKSARIQIYDIGNEILEALEEL